MAMLDAALAYVSKGFRVFPCKLDKTPLTPHGLKDATMTQLGVREYWGKWPDAGIGVTTDGLVVLDFDVKNNGLESKELIENNYGTLPPTRIHQTGGGGYHYLYRNPNGSDIRNTVCLGGYKGVDLRANGGYIVVPPSKHPSGNKYKVLEKVEIAPAPEWLISLYRTRVGWGVGGGDVGGGESIPDGQRNQTLTSLAGTMRRRGMSYDAILAALKATKCQTPLSDKELETIAKSVTRYVPDPLASLTDIPDVNADIADKLDVNADNADRTDKTDKTLTNADKSLTNADFEANSNLDKAIWKLVDQWMAFHEGERFDLDTLCRQLNVTNRDHRHSVVKKLSYEVGKGKIEKSVNVRPPIYRLRTYTILRMNWRESTGAANVSLAWPSGQDATQFGFDGRVEIPEKGLIVLAGVSNVGKSVFCRNFLWANMDAHHCVYFSSETSEDDFADYVSRMTWANPINEDGTDKFELISRDGDFKDVIEPDSVNIVDWLDIYENFYSIGEVLNGMKSRLNKGIILVAIQKDPNKGLGVGGMWAMHKASLYMTMDFNRLYVEKAKKWSERNPNHQSWGFDIIDRGVHLNNIRLLKKCGHCWNGKIKGTECSTCNGTGFVDADRM